MWCRVEEGGALALGGRSRACPPDFPRSRPEEGSRLPRSEHLRQLRAASSLEEGRRFLSPGVTFAESLGSSISLGTCVTEGQVQGSALTPS